MEKSQEILEKEKKADPKRVLEEYQLFLNELETDSKPEKKLKICLEFMRNALSKDSTPAFRNFWEAKRLCLELFKEKITPRVRTLLWQEYIELSEEIRKIKQILDSEASFAQEQIELAIDSAENELSNSSTQPLSMEAQESAKDSKTLQKKGAEYAELQGELDILNAFASRLNGLRKELIQTQMRMGIKNRLFQRLSQLGDHIFPRRKELVERISTLYLEDIECFVTTHFTLENPPYFGLKDEIKALQSFAKILSLSTKAFTQGRECLSDCWDQIKEKEIAFREKRSALKELYKENYKVIASKVAAFKEEVESNDPSLKEAEEKIDFLLNEMKELKLGAEEVKTLKKELFQIKAPLEEKEKQAQKERKQAEQLEKKRQEETLQNLLNQLVDVVNQAEVLSLDALVEKWEAFVKEKKTLNVMGFEQAILENRLGSVVDHIQEKKWQALNQHAGEDLSSGLHSLLNERHKEKRKIKEILEQHRKVIGGSGLSLEQSMLYQELIAEERMRLDSIETMVEEIEEKLFDLEE